MEYYLARTYALLLVLKHNFPIVIDCFRGGELSTKKEDFSIKKFSEIDNQVILTATLKEAEFGRYEQFDYVNGIDFVDVKPSKLLNRESVKQFRNMISKFGIVIE